MFRFIYQLTDDEESVKVATRSVINEFAQDNVQYLELRTTPRACEETGKLLITLCFGFNRDLRDGG